MNNAKVTVPPSVATAIAHFVNLADTKTEALTDILSLGYETEQSEIILRHFDGDYDLLMEALICGYQIEKSPEDKVREYYENLYYAAEKTCVEHTLDLLGIKIAGVNADE
ncbi:hypothetical protein [Neobacillus niacini]|uniref:hypothetical protein n=1 Tax=Neobacillus niacini TaxID=86668 RepID=UPI002861DDD5|nr:hypothetical protein [Neobacillus niacini]MDR7001634.1 ssRNA-specific RNase YbeY (16S rRNA maturation enzyme) [Neobacillus niacini]